MEQWLPDDLVDHILKLSAAASHESVMSELRSTINHQLAGFELSEFGPERSEIYETRRSDSRCKKRVLYWRERHGMAQMNGDDGCLDVQTWHVANANRSVSQEYRNRYKIYIDKLIDATRYKNHLIGVDLRDIRNNNQDIPLRILRMRYLRNYISEDEWTKSIKSIHKLTRKNDDYMAVLGFVPDILNDLIRDQLGT